MGDFSAEEALMKMSGILAMVPGMKEDRIVQFFQEEQLDVTANENEYLFWNKCNVRINVGE
jgi:hypothetical protein